MNMKSDKSSVIISCTVPLCCMQHLIHSIMHALRVLVLLHPMNLIYERTDLILTCVHAQINNFCGTVMFFF